MPTEQGNGLGWTGADTQPVVQIEDASGNPIAGDTTTVTLAIGTNPSGGTLSGCTGTSNGNGQVTFSGCKIDKAGTGYTLTATDAADNLTTPSVPSYPLNVAVGPAAQLSFTTSPGTTVAGDKFGTRPVVTIQDLGGNTVTANTSTGLVGHWHQSGRRHAPGLHRDHDGGRRHLLLLLHQQAGERLHPRGERRGHSAPGTSTPFNIVTPALTSFSVTSSTNNPTAGTPFQRDDHGPGPVRLHVPGVHRALRPSPSVARPVPPTEPHPCIRRRSTSAPAQVRPRGVKLYDAQKPPKITA